MSYGLTLAVDGSTYAGSVAVLRDATVLASRELANVATPGRGGREEKFLPMVAACLEEAAVKAVDLERVVCGAGPGSFTSLRVAASIAKGIAIGTGCPLFAVSSLMLIVADAAPGRYLATMAAMRGEVFAGLFEVSANGHVSELRAPVIIAENDVNMEAAGARAVVVGDAAVQEAHPVGNPRAEAANAPSSQLPHARCVAKLLPSVIAAGECDIATWEPTYGRLAEAQVRWEAAHGRPLTAAG